MTYLEKVLVPSPARAEAAANLRKTVRYVLNGAKRKLLKGRWTRETTARDASGEDISPTSPKAVSFCAVGAMLATKKGEVAAARAQQAVETLALQGGSLADYNDSVAKNKHQIIRLFNTTVEQLETYDFLPYV